MRDYYRIAMQMPDPILAKIDREREREQEIKYRIRQAEENRRLRERWGTPLAENKNSIIRQPAPKSSASTIVLGNSALTKKTNVSVRPGQIAKVIDTTTSTESLSEKFYTSYWSTDELPIPIRSKCRHRDDKATISTSRKSKKQKLRRKNKPRRRRLSQKLFCRALYGRHRELLRQLGSPTGKYN
jgi:hypothetical protein